MKQIFPKPTDAPAPKPLTLGDLAPGDFFRFTEQSQNTDSLMLALGDKHEEEGRVHYVQFDSDGIRKEAPFTNGHSAKQPVIRVKAAIFELPQDQAACPK